MSKKKDKPIEVTELKCPHCGEITIKTKEDLEGYYNWKCDHCFKISPFGSVIGVIWNTWTGTPPRQKS